MELNIPTVLSWVDLNFEKPGDFDGFYYSSLRRLHLIMDARKNREFFRVKGSCNGQSGRRTEYDETVADIDENLPSGADLVCGHMCLMTAAHRSCKRLGIPVAASGSAATLQKVSAKTSCPSVLDCTAGDEGGKGHRPRCTAPSLLPASE